MSICRADRRDADAVAPLIAKFRVELKRLRGINPAEELEPARREFAEYIDAGYPMFLWREQDICCGYMVCRVQEPVVWVESLYVLSDYRRKGVGGALFAQAERLASSHGEDTLYNYVHPNNAAMIAFLRARGYDVLNLIEIRRAYAGEEMRGAITVGQSEFRY